MVTLLFELAKSGALVVVELNRFHNQESHRFELFFVVHDKRRIRLELRKGNRVILTIFVGRNTL